ncbi:MAG: hypothetical protein KDM63_05235 [Verrucomicrobiae bacterium]|nr:hypothetical protein [Verrucomicrobiae bacterium]
MEHLPAFEPVLAIFRTVPRDPAIYFAFGLTLLGIQALIWGIARDNTDIEWWRSSAVAIVAVVIGSMILSFIVRQETFSAIPILGGIFGCGFAVWLIGGFLYELEIWQRLTLSLASPIIGGVGMFLGVLLRNLIIGGLSAPA